MVPPHAHEWDTTSFLRPTPITFNLTILRSHPLCRIAFTCQPPFKVECRQLCWSHAVHLAFAADHFNFGGGGVSGVPSCLCDRQVKCDGGGLIFQRENLSLHVTFLYSRTVQALEMLTPVTVLAGSPGELRPDHSYVES